MVPPVARRAAALLRRRRSDAPPWGFDPLWPQQPEVRAWLEDAVLAWERLPAVFGARWAEDLASGFAAGEGPATETVLRLAAPAALEASLAGLRR
jgi:hypothetical protein